MSSDSGFASGLRWVAAGRLSAQLISWLGTIYVMRTLVPQDYGLAAICSSIIAIVMIVAEFGMGASVIQAKKLEDAQIRSIFGASLLFSFSCAAMLVLAAPLLTWFFRAPEAINLIRASALHLVLSPLSTIPEAILRRDLRFRGVSVIEFVTGISASLATVALAWYGAGVWSIVTGPLVGALARVIMINLLAPQRLAPSLNLRPAAGMLDFGFKVAISRLASTVFGQSDVLIAGRFLSKAALGEYSVGMTLAMLPVSKAMGILNQVTYPTIAKMHREGQSLQPVLLEGLRLFAYVLVPLLWGMAAVAPWLISSLIGPHWEQAVLPMQIVCLALPLRMISVLLSSVLQGMGQAGMEVRNTMTGVVLLPLCFLAGAPFGATGLALAWLVGLPLLIVVNLHRARDVMKLTIRDALLALSKPVALSGVMAASTLALGHGLGPQLSDWLRLSMLVPCAIALYLVLLWTLDRPCAIKLISLLKIGR